MSDIVTITVSPDTRDLVRSQKRGGETYDSLLRKMVAQYDPVEGTTNNNTEKQQMTTMSGEHDE